MSATNGGADWGRMFADLQDAYRGPDGRRPSYTAVFNSHLDALIAEKVAVPLEWRLLAWIWRKSWGNNSECAVDKIGGKALGQNDAAEAFGVRKQRISECVAILRELNFLLCNHRYELYPVVDPTTQKRIKGEPESGAQRTHRPFFAFLEDWKVRSTADFEAFESARAEYERVREVRWQAYQEWRRGRTPGGASLYTTSPTVPTEESSSSSAVEVTVSEQPKAEEEEERPYDQFKQLYPPDHFNEAEAKPSFEGLKPEDKRRCLERLNQYLACERWKEDEGRWIPLASNWLTKWDADPPPVIRKKAAASASGSSIFQEMARELIEERKRGGS